jgi:hypothetical protein
LPHRVRRDAWPRHLNDADMARSPAGKHDRASIGPGAVAESAAETQGNSNMTRGLIVLAAVATLGAASVPAPALAGNGGAVAAGVIGGLAVGSILGAAAAQPRYYAPEPVYAAPPPSCYWTRGEPVWDGYRGMWIRPRVQVCD